MSDDHHPRGEFRWGIRTSFIDYLQLMSDSVIEFEGCTQIEDPTRFVFPQAAERAADATTLRYTGRIRFEAHGGMLALSLADPWVHRLDDTAAVSFVEPGGKRIVVATIERLERAGSLWKGPAVLADTGEPLFAGNYGAGDEFDPIEFTTSD